MTLPKVGTILFLVSLSLYPSSELKAQPKLEAKEAINFMETQYNLRNIQYNLRNIQYNLRNIQYNLRNNCLQP